MIHFYLKDPLTFPALCWVNEVRIECLHCHTPYSKTPSYSMYTQFIYRFCKVVECFLDQWFKGFVKPIHKEGSRNSLNNYREIALNTGSIVFKRDLSCDLIAKISRWTKEILHNTSPDFFFFFFSKRPFSSSSVGGVPPHTSLFLSPPTLPTSNFYS